MSAGRRRAALLNGLPPAHVTVQRLSRCGLRESFDRQSLLPGSEALAVYRGAEPWFDLDRSDAMCYLSALGRGGGPRGGHMAQVVGFIGLGIMGRPMAKNL